MGEEVKTSLPICEYIKQLYKHGQEVKFGIFEGPRQPRYLVTKADVEAAIRSLGNKATGVDELDARVIKRRGHKQQLVQKLATTFNHWLTTNKVPKYVKTGKLLNLSKDGTEYPGVGQIRTISMGCGLFKMFETTVLEKLKVQMEKLNLIHPKQRGFQANKSTAQNINELLKLVSLARE